MSVRRGTVILFIWLIIGAVAAGQRRRVQQLPVRTLETLHDRHCPR